MLFKVKGKVSFIGFPKGGAVSDNGFYMFSIKDVEVLEGNVLDLQFTRYNTLNLRGYLSKCEVGQAVELEIVYHSKDSYGAKYEIKEEIMNFNIDSEEELEAFLHSIKLTERQRDILSKVDNLIDIIKNKDIDALTEIKGIGKTTALRIMDKYDKAKDMLKYYELLYTFGFENLQHRIKIVSYFTNKIERAYKAKNGDDEDIPREELDKAMAKQLNKIKINPYTLTCIDGFGLETVDDIAITYLKIPHNSVYRIKSFVIHILNEAGNMGKSYLHYENFINILREATQTVKINRIKQTLPIDLSTFKQAFSELQEEGKVMYNPTYNIVASSYFFNLEKEVSEELLRILSSSNDDFLIEDIDEKIDDVESRQGYPFAVKQREGIKMIVNNMLSVLTGAAGTGKSSTLNGATSLYEGFSIGLFALSGRASQRMTETTGLPAQTMHMHISKFHSEDSGETYDIYIIDESSMVHLELLRDFLKTIPTGKKLIFLGDVHQLQAITTGNLLDDLIKCGKLPVTMLNEIFRQGLNSGILSTSLSVRNQTQLCNKYCNIEEIIGINKDFELIVRKESTEFKDFIVNKFNRDLEAVNGNILDVQILTPLSKSGDYSVKSINKLIQKAFSHRLSEEYLEFGDTRYHLGDKVINIKNNYKAKKEDSEEATAVFNGNIGIVADFIRDKKDNITGIIVDFTACGRIVYEKADCTNLSLAYAITTHKAQGSENKRIIYVLSNIMPSMLNCEQVYTAITRAKEYCTVIAQSYALYTAISNREAKEKLTFLSKFLGGEL